MYLNEVLADLQHELDAILTDETRHKSARRGSRFAGPGASTELAERLASGGDVFVSPPATRSDSHTLKRPGLGYAMKALAEGTASSGGYLVPQEYADEILGMVRARVAVRALGPTVIPVAKELDVTSQSTGATAYYTAENSAIPVSEATFAQAALLRPKVLAALVPVSNRLLRDAAINPSLDSFLMLDLAEVIALREDLAFVSGTGTGGEPLGIRNTEGLTPAPSLGVDGGTPDFDTLKTTVANIRATNAPFRKPGWVFHPRLLSTLEQIKTTDGAYIADAGLLTFDAAGTGGTLLGYKFATSSQIPVNLTTGGSSDTSVVLFGSDWNEAVIGEETSGLLLDTSSEAAYTADGGSTWISAFQSQQTLFRAVLAHDIALRRPQFFTVLEGVRP